MFTLRGWEENDSDTDMERQCACELSDGEEERGYILGGECSRMPKRVWRGDGGQGVIEDRKDRSRWDERYHKYGNRGKTELI